MKDVLSRAATQMVAAGAALLAGTALFSCVYRVEPGERAIVFNRFGKGISSRVRGEGFHLYLAPLQEIIKYDIRTNPHDFKTFTGTKDLQRVEVKIRIFYRPLEQYLPKIHLDFNKDYVSRILPSIGNEVLKAVVAQYDAEHLLRSREKVSKEIRDALTARAKNYHIILEDVSLYELQFMPEFLASIEKKQMAQQEAEKYKFVVMQNEEEKNAKIIESEGRAIAARMVSDAAAKYGHNLIEYKRIEAAKQIAEKLANAPNVSFVPPSMNLLMSV